MRILLIEDDVNKAEQIEVFVTKVLPDASLEVCRAFQSGLKTAILAPPDLILLDMTMSSYEVGTRELGGRERRYAGREILRQLARRSLRTPVIVITQYEQFEQDGKIVTLKELEAELRADYAANFVDAVFYQASNTSWMESLEKLLVEQEKAT